MSTIAEVFFAFALVLGSFGGMSLWAAKLRMIDTGLAEPADVFVKIVCLFAYIFAIAGVNIVYFQWAF